MRDSAPKPTFADQLPKLRFGLLLAAFISLFLLSASHTIEAFTYNIDSWAANAAPVAFEVALIGFTLSTQSSERRNWLTTLTIVLIVIATVIANGVSGISVANTKTGSTDFGLYHLFALIVAPIVPFSTIVIGHLLSDTLLRWRVVDRVSDAWNAVEIEVLYRAAQAELVRRGLTAGRAGRLAFDLTRGYLGTSTIALMQANQPANQPAQQSPTLIEVPASVQPSVSVASVIPANGSTNERTERTANERTNEPANEHNGRTRRNPNALTDLHEWARTSGTDVTGLSVDQFWQAAKSANVVAGRTSAAQVLAELQGDK